MQNTCYCSNSEIIPDKVYGYNYCEGGLKQKPYLDHTWPYAAGSLCCASEDLLIWMIAIHEGKVFDDHFYELYVSPVRLDDGSKFSDYY